MDSYPKCPLFQCTCIREMCTAFEIREFAATGFQRMDEMEIYHLKMAERDDLIHKQAWCNALKVVLPEVK